MTYKLRPIVNVTGLVLNPVAFCASRFPKNRASRLGIYFLTSLSFYTTNSLIADEKLQTPLSFTPYQIPYQILQEEKEKRQLIGLEYKLSEEYN